MVRLVRRTAPVPPAVTPSVTVLGAGHGGLAVAAILLRRGLPVTLYNRSPERLTALRAGGGLTLTGPEQPTCTVQPRQMTSDLAAAAAADCLLLAVPASAHRELAARLAPHLRSGQTVILHPGRTFGAVEFLHVLRLAGCRADVVVAETDSLLCAARSDASGRVCVFGVKRTVRLATLPSAAARAVVGALSPFLPELSPAGSVLETSFGNVGAILHPAPTLLNLARIDGGCPFEYYRQGITPVVARVLERLDDERRAVAAAYGAEVPSACEWLGRAYGVRGESLHAAVQANAAYRGIPSPQQADCRYLHEDVPTGLVPLAALGGLASVPTPTADALIDLASAACNLDFRERGRSLVALGLAGWGAGQVRNWLAQGECDA